MTQESAVPLSGPNSSLTVSVWAWMSHSQDHEGEIGGNGVGTEHSVS